MLVTSKMTFGFTWEPIKKVNLVTVDLYGDSILDTDILIVSDLLSCLIVAATEQ